MAKSNGNGNSEKNTPVEKEAPTVSANQMKQLFAAYSKTATDVEKQEQVLEDFMQKRSDAVKAISETCGTGPFRFKGQLVTIRGRGPTDKRPNAKETFYFVSIGDQDIISVD